jgi:AraC-like DNA-binding protein
MYFDTTTIASVVSVIIEALQKSYNLDARPTLDELGLDLTRLDVPGARYPDPVLVDLLEIFRKKTGDDCIGLAIGRYVRPTTFHALSYAWLASGSVLGALQRLARYDEVVSTADQIEIISKDKTCELILEPRRPEDPTPDHSVDAYFIAILEMCRWITSRNFVPLEIHLQHGDAGRPADYLNAFGAPVSFNANRNRMVFEKASVERRLPGVNAELAQINDRIAQEYVASLDSATVAKSVRQLLMQLLPSGDASQERIAQRLNRSCSSLQRDLRSEGTSFRDLREETRKMLATEYIRDRDVTLQEIAFLLGFSDQSNFSRAFRRWTGESPKGWRETNQGGQD